MGTLSAEAVVIAQFSLNRRRSESLLASAIVFGVFGGVGQVALKSINVSALKSEAGAS